VPPQRIHVPEHRTEKVECGESVYCGVLTHDRRRKVVRVFLNASPSKEDEFVLMHQVPLEARTVIERSLDHLEELYFPA
jgi:hypothetical protein